MTIKEINAMREKQRKIAQEKQDSQQSFNEVHYRIMEDLDLQETIAHDELVKRIKKHFKGITPSIDITNWHILISFNDVEFLDHRYGNSRFQGISKKLYTKIIAEYEEVYGEIVENAYAGNPTYGTITVNGDFSSGELDWNRQ